MYILNEKIKNKSNIVGNLEVGDLNHGIYLKRKHLKKGQLKHYPSSTKEWYNSIYSFKKDNSAKILFLKDKMIYKLFYTYFNKLRDYKYNSLSTNKIFVGIPEIKHFNNKINITIYIYNKWITYFSKITGITIILSLCNKLYSKLLAKIINDKYIKLLYKHIYKYVLNKKVFNEYVFKEYFFIKKINKSLYLHIIYYFFNYIKFPKMISILKIALFNSKEKRINNLMIILENLNKIYYGKLKINSLDYLIRLINVYLMINKLLKSIYLLKWYKRNILFNMYKFNIKNLLIIKSLINNLYNKRIEVNIVNLKYLYLDGNILALAIVKKLKNRKRRVLRIIRMSLRLSKKPYFNKFYSSFLNGNNLDNTLVKKKINLSFNRESMLLNKDLICKPISYKSRLIFYYLNHKVISGMKLQGTGRLTKRLTASRSISKSISKGSLKNKVSSYNGLSTVVLRGYVKSNLQYVNINSYNRIGAYGIKSWISSF